MIQALPTPTNFGDIYVIFHGRKQGSGAMTTCPDGIASAWAVHHLLARINLKVKRFFCCDYGWEVEAYPHFLTGDFVYVVDFSLPKDYYEFGKGVTFCTFDHHKRAYELLFAPELETQINGKFDIDESGATLTWKELAQAIAQDAPLPMPHFLNYVRDRDIWTKKLDGCDAVYSLMSAVRSTIYRQFPSPNDLQWKNDAWIRAQFGLYDALYAIDQSPAGDPYQVMAALGQCLDDAKRLKAETIAQEGKLYQLSLVGLDTDQSYQVRVVTINPEDAALTSYVGEALHNQNQIVGMMVLAEVGKVELRSPKGYPCLPIASYFGGGGHDCACGFKGNVLLEAGEIVSSDGTIKTEFHPV